MRRIALKEYGEGEHVVAYRDRIYRFTGANDEEDQALAAEAAEFLGVEQSSFSAASTTGWDVWELVEAVKEQKQEALVGRIEEDDLFVEAGDYRHGRGSRLLRSVLRHLGLSAVKVEGMDDGIAEDIPAREVTGRIPDALLHGTSSVNMGGILRRGLAADETRSNYELQDIRHADTVFLTDNPFKAAYHAEHACHRGESRPGRPAPAAGFPVVVEFAIPDKARLVPDWDIDVWSERGGAYERSREMRQRLRDLWRKPTTQEDPFKLSRKFGVFGYRGRIPPAFIRSMEIRTGEEEEGGFSPENWTKVTREQLERAIEYGEPGAWEWEDACPECGEAEGDCECERCEECGEAMDDCECGMPQRCPSCGYVDDQRPARCHRCGKPWTQGVVARFWRARRVVASAGPDFDPEYYMGEACAYFALALHELYGYRLRMLVDEGEEYEDGIPLPAHVYAVDPDGNAVDARGRRSEAEVRAEFYDLIEPRTYDVTPGELERDWMGYDDDKPLYGPSVAEVEEAKHIILSAPGHDTLWPAPAGPDPNVSASSAGR